ncbi:hypothetical protein [Brevundimonas bullata]
MTIDWSATGSMLSGIGTLVGAGAVVWAANKAADTFEGWKKQKIAERHIEQAERILTAAYEANDAINYARGRFIHSWEIDEAQKQEEKHSGWLTFLEAKQRRVSIARARLNRLRNCKDEQEALRVCRPIAKALWGEDLHKSLTDFHHQFWILETYIQAYAGDEDGTDPNFTKKISQAIASSTDDRDDEISAATINCIKNIENTLLPVLRPAKIRQ